MKKYKITFWMNRCYHISIFVEADDENVLDMFVREFYPDTNWTWEEI